MVARVPLHHHHPTVTSSEHSLCPALCLTPTSPHAQSLSRAVSDPRERDTAGHDSCSATTRAGRDGMKSASKKETACCISASSHGHATPCNCGRFDMLLACSVGEASDVYSAETSPSMIPALRSHTPTLLSARVAFVGLNPGRMGLGKDCLEHETAIKKDEKNERDP